MRVVPALMLCLALARGDVPADLVHQVPDFQPTSFKVYSGFLTVKGPFNLTDYDELQIHYQLDCSQRSANDPVVTWHQGGPGGSSMIGGWTEMGYFQVSDAGPFVNPYAWNRRANMLYLESPAGSHDPIGFSTCLKNGEVQRVCDWNDKSQAEAYAHTLLAFFEAFPEFKNNDLYLTGESYAGQYIPNIAYFITTEMPSKFTNLKGIAVGNGCWGGTANTVVCNGPHAERNDVDLFFGKGLMSKELRDHVYKACGYDGGFPGPECPGALLQMDNEVGPHNVYDIYDNCAGAAQWSAASGKTLGWLRRYLRENMHDPKAIKEAQAMGGGYNWACGGIDDTAKYFEREDVQKALHLDKPNKSLFNYQSSGPASVTLYPHLVKKMRILIYNGDADSCVPYIGNEEWTTDLAKTGAITELKSWHPWFESTQSPVPAGYATTYNVTGAPDKDFSFVTIRLAGHMVPTFQPGPAYAFFDRFLSHQPF